MRFCLLEISAGFTTKIFWRVKTAEILTWYVHKSVYTIFWIGTPSKAYLSKRLALSVLRSKSSSVRSCSCNICKYSKCYCFAILTWIWHFWSKERTALITSGSSFKTEVAEVRRLRRRLLRLADIFFCSKSLFYYIAFFLESPHPHEYFPASRRCSDSIRKECTGHVKMSKKRFRVQNRAPIISCRGVLQLVGAFGLWTIQCVKSAILYSRQYMRVFALCFLAQEFF